MPSRIKKKKGNRKAEESLAILLPSDGSHAGFLRSSVDLARALGAPLRLLISSVLLEDRPSRVAFYSRLLEEEELRGSFSWGKRIYADSAPALFRSFHGERDYLALIKNEDSRSLIKTALKEAACPVVTIPGNFNQEIRNIMLAYVGGRFSEKALRVAALIGKHGRARIEVVTVGAVSTPVLRVAHARAEYLFRLFKVKARYRMLCGEARQTLLTACREAGTHLLIMGSSETHHWRDHRFRALSDIVADEADCPVMIVK
jgi:nucleotide-binding universal stress UspA family protein